MFPPTITKVLEARGKTEATMKKRKKILSKNPKTYNEEMSRNFRTEICNT